jgi:hypothetical protein
MENRGLITVLTFIAIALSTSFTKPSASRVYANTVVTLEPKEMVPFDVEEIEIKIVNIDETESFLDAIGHKESGNNYDIVNSYGYMGRYQFGKRTLRGLGYNVTQEEFLSSPEVQEMAMMSLLKHNKKKLQKYIDQYSGDTLHGVYITESGVLAAAHLAGAGNVRKFFKRGNEFKDGYGTSMTSYMTQFGGYRLFLD